MHTFDVKEIRSIARRKSFMIGLLAGFMLPAVVLGFMERKLDIEFFQHVTVGFVLLTPICSILLYLFCKLKYFCMFYQLLTRTYFYYAFQKAVSW